MDRRYSMHRFFLMNECTFEIILEVRGFEVLGIVKRTNSMIVTGGIKGLC